MIVNVFQGCTTFHMSLPLSLMVYRKDHRYYGHCADQIKIVLSFFFAAVRKLLKLEKYFHMAKIFLFKKQNTGQWGGREYGTTEYSDYLPRRCRKSQAMAVCQPGAEQR